MKLLRFITEEEHAKLKELSQREALQSDNNGNYFHADPQYVNSPLKGDTDVKWINELLEQVIEGFRSFSNFMKSKPDTIRLQYEWGPTFTGVGWVTIDELKDGFECQD